MKRTKKKLGEYWDKTFVKATNARYIDLESEIREHFGFISLTIKRVIIPVILLYILLGLLLKVNIFGSLFVSTLIFLYSNFLPDVDFLIRKTDREIKESLWYERYLLLFFAPIIVYYAIIGKAKPIYSRQYRCFHNIQTMLIYGIFLIVAGHVFWDETIKIVMFTIFGVGGYAFHLIVDEIMIGSKLIKKRIQK